MANDPPEPTDRGYDDVMKVAFQSTDLTQTQKDKLWKFAGGQMGWSSDYIHFRGQPRVFIKDWNPLNPSHGWLVLEKLVEKLDDDENIAIMISKDSVDVGSMKSGPVFHAESMWMAVCRMALALALEEKK